jgi:YidC/Oxa1 family membrane protein insertase
MEKRTMLTMVLSMGIIFAWMMYSNKKAAEYQSAMRATNEAFQSVEKPETRTQNLKAEDVPIPSLPPSKIITKDYGLVQVNFDLRGATLRGYLLKEYHEKGKNVNLVVLKSNSRMGAYATYLGMNKELAFVPFVEVPGPDKFATTFRYVSDGRAGIPAGMTVEKTYRFEQDSYLFELEVVLKNSAAQSISMRDAGLQQLTVDFLMQPDRIEKNFFNQLQMQYAENGKIRKVNNPDKLKRKMDDLPYGDNYEWSAIAQRYFVVGIVPYDRQNSKRPDFYIQGLNFSTRIQERLPLSFNPGESVSYKFYSYAGPKDRDVFRNYRLKYPHVYGLISFEKAMGFSQWVGPISNFLLDVLSFIHKFVGNYGVAIIIVTLLIKVVFSPLTFKQHESMNRMKEVQPLLNALREKYKDDPQRMNLEQMKIYKEKKINPLGGCLPLLVQIPVFIAFYNLLATSIKLREAPFLWIKDLANPDTIATIGSFGINILPLLMTLTMFIQQKMTPSMGDPQQQKIMMLMPFIMLFIFYGLPSGLVLYWTAQNIFSIIEMFVIHEKLKKAKTS